ncbi:MAG: HD domain-containing protein [Sporomusaceae bacterium]|nr:HD domain-containing protein [Sporomusaceae bacterium]
MRNAIVELLPEINWLDQAALREAVITCYVEAMAAGGWQPQDLDRMPFALALDGCKVSYLRHTRAVTRMCRGILAEYNTIYLGQGGFRLDPDRLLAGALLHDIGKLLEWTETPDGRFGKSETGKLLRHPLSGAALALRNGIGYDIAHIIAYHSHEGDTAERSPEAEIVNKVDMMNFYSIRSQHFAKAGTD